MLFRSFLGYVNNAIASALAGNRSRLLIGLLVQSLSNPIFTDVHEAIEVVLGPSGHSALIMCGGVEKGVEDAALRTLTSLRPDEIMLAGYSGSTSSLYRAVQAVILLFQQDFALLKSPHLFCGNHGIIVKLYLLIGFEPTGQSARKDSVLLVQLTLCLPIVVQTHDAFPELFRVSRGFFGHLLCTSLSNVSLSE